MQRKAMVPFEFSNGSIVPPGNLVAIPQREIMRDPARYSSPEAFNPYRFMAASPTTEVVTKYTDMNWDYTFWGSPHLPCPGRWYASYAMKHVLVHLLTTYDFDLVGPKDRKRWFTWTTAIVPKSDININISRRAEI
jgi:cytochrome P450